MAKAGTWGGGENRKAKARWTKERWTTERGIEGGREGGRKKDRKRWEGRMVKGEKGEGNYWEKS